MCNHKTGVCYWCIKMKQIVDTEQAGFCTFGSIVEKKNKPCRTDNYLTNTCSCLASFTVFYVVVEIL